MTAPHKQITAGINFLATHAHALEDLDVIEVSTTGWSVSILLRDADQAETLAARLGTTDPGTDGQTSRLWVLSRYIAYPGLPEWDRLDLRIVGRVRTDEEEVAS